jgi:error-prone DNA polymerase
VQWLDLTWQIMGFPRHLSQHVGGFVLTQTQLTRLVPVENASMKDRSVIQWDKDDLEDMGLMKVDVLALGMLTAIRRCLDFVAQRRGTPFTIYDIAPEDPATYEMIRRADTVGVFQIESRAQMSMLPRLKPTVFYDLVVEVAIVRPGPISGGMVHPYLKARERLRQGLEIHYEKPALKEALGRTLGVPIFQEQVMQIAMVATGFTASEADALRRAMAAWKRKGGVDKFRERLVGGMLDKGYRRDFAEAIFKQVEGFGDYGFPESHAYSFALLAYKSSWLKCHEPACFLAAMLNSQPMGFYAPSQLIQDAQRHGVLVLPPDVSHSDWDSTLEQLGSEPHCSVRLGLRLVGSLSEAGGQRIVKARAEKPFADVEDMALRAQLDVKDLKSLSAGDALTSLAGHRRQQVWEASAQLRAPALLRDAPIHEQPLLLEAATEGEEIVFDYASLGLTLRRHPMALLRPRLARRKLLNSKQLQALPDGRRVAACGMVTVRQQPQTAKGTIFVTLEDEDGQINVIVWQGVRERYRDALLRSRLLVVHGTWQRDVDSGGQVCHLVADRLEDLSPLLGRLARQRSSSRDFH